MGKDTNKRWVLADGDPASSRQIADGPPTATPTNLRRGRRRLKHTNILMYCFCCFNLLRGYQRTVMSSRLSNSILTVSPVVQSSGCRMLRVAPPASPQTHQQPTPPIIYSCIISAANCFVNGTIPSPSPVNTMSLTVLIILLLA